MICTHDAAVVYREWRNARGTSDFVTVVVHYTRLTVLMRAVVEFLPRRRHRHYDAVYTCIHNAVIIVVVVWFRGRPLAKENPRRKTCCSRPRPPRPRTDRRDGLSGHYYIIIIIVYVKTVAANRSVSGRVRILL
jgi:hypothetical protein